MSQLDRYSGGSAALSALPSDLRRAGRSISRLQSHAAVRLAGIDSETDVALGKIDAVTATTGQAMSAVVRVAQAQRQLELFAPEASARLAMLADDHALTLSDITADLRRQLRGR